MNAIILCAQGMEECEALVVYDLLYRAKIDVKLVGLNDTILSSHGVEIKPHLLIDDVKADDYDCLILPGGMPGTKNLDASSQVHKLIDDFHKQDKYICAICAAPSILIKKGLVNDHKFICFPGHECGLTPADVKAYQDGKIITGKGLGAAIEFSHIIISNLVSKEVADDVLYKIQY